MELRKYWEIILRRKWIIIITFLVIFLTSAIGANVATKIYEGKARILVETPPALTSLLINLGVPASALPQDQTTSDYTYDTEIALTSIRPLVEKLITNLNLKNNEGETLKFEETSFSIMDLIIPQPYIDIEQYEDSALLKITGGSTNREEAAKIANELANLYIEDTVQRARDSYKIARLFIENKIRAVKDEYYNSLLEKKEFMLKEGTVDLAEETKDLLDYILTLKNDYKNNEFAIAQANESINLIEKKIAGKAPVSSALVNNMQTQLNNLLVDIAAKKIELTDEHPDVIQLNKQIDTIRRLLKEKIEVTISDKEISIAPVYEELLRNLKDAYIARSTGTIKREQLQKFIDKAQGELMKIPYKSTRYAELGLSLSVNQDIYKNLLEYQNQVGVAESMTLSNIKLVEPAVVPEAKRQYFPPTIVIYVLGLFLGTFWAFSLGFFIDYLDHTINGPEDLKDYRFTFLGSIPEFKKGKYLVTMTDPNDPVYEAYHKVLTSIHFASLEKPNKKLLITSLQPRAGCSTTIANLGILLAREGKKVLLVDADLRRPNFHTLFGLSNTTGLTDLVLENASIDRVIQSSGINGLDILTAGPTPPDSGMLIKSDKMSGVIKQLEGKYDMLIFHAAPLLLKNDALQLMKNLDDMVILLKNKSTAHPSIIKADELLKNANITPAGVVLNCV